MFRFSNSILHESIESIRTGEHRVFKLAVSQLDGSGRPASVVCVLELHPGYAERPIAYSLYVSISRGVYGDSPLNEIQEQWTTLAREGARNLDVSYGMITLDHPTGLETPYEERMGIDADDGVRSSIDHVRGYYWANILSSRHIDKLGGLDAVRLKAPCEIVETIQEGTDPLVYLQLTHDLDSVSDSDLRQLRDFLSPVLLPGRPSHPHMGPPVRVLVD